MSSYGRYIKVCIANMKNKLQSQETSLKEHAYLEIENCNIGVS